MYTNVSKYQILAEVPVDKNRILKIKIFINAFVTPRVPTYGFPQKISARLVQPFGQL